MEEQHWSHKRPEATAEWAAKPHAVPRYTEVAIPGVSSEALRQWASIVEEANPIGDVGSYANVEANYDVFMGVELTFVGADGAPALVLALFSDEPNAEEQAIIDEDDRSLRAVGSGS